MKLILTMHNVTEKFLREKSNPAVFKLLSKRDYSAKRKASSCIILHLSPNLQWNEVSCCVHSRQQNPSAISFSAKPIISFHVRNLTNLTSSAGHLPCWNRFFLLCANNILIFLLHWPDFTNFVICIPTSVLKNCDNTVRTKTCSMVLPSLTVNKQKLIFCLSLFRAGSTNPFSSLYSLAHVLATGTNLDAFCTAPFIILILPLVPLPKSLFNPTLAPLPWVMYLRCTDNSFCLILIQHLYTSSATGVLVLNEALKRGIPVTLRKASHIRILFDFWDSFMTDLDVEIVDTGTFKEPEITKSENKEAISVNECFNQMWLEE